ncbi:Gfo/Idh/MocA family oxidoreductase [Scandinavium sp. H11S7]|uniref:Gfo/Idh/MocA family oxidoreductase n=1 Tax=Scandinavium hiltneri TaxID=2926519 RepID=A0ABT2DZL3_9ENTR|nr:Gfo/Idh/MocA family oxidoreductase [Scandinavium hiltneri]MCS2156588.1 Gfo/Idh/MocA family oxidoreductase [Scandinavium hiltneri]MCS2160212.1 Gfo/Idh/MocA family oxidoreductase [Scandinavium hiltneri]
MKTLNAAIIGCGAIHTCHVEALRQTPGVVLRAIVDIDPDKGRALSGEYDCAFYQDYREMLCDVAIDVVHICTPHYLHKPMVLAALAAGKQVFCEKPVGMNMADIVEMRAAEKQADGRLGVCYQNRLNPTSLALRQLLSENALGRLLSINAFLTWSRTPPYYANSPWRGRYASEGGSLLINQAIHTLDLVQWFGGGVTRLKGVVDCARLEDTIDTEDTAMATLEFSGGARGLFFASNNHTRDTPLQLDIHCEQGELQLRDNTLWRVSDDKRVMIASDETPYGHSKRYWGNGHINAIRQFYDAVRSDRHSGVTGLNDAAKSLHMVEAIYRSSQLRQWVTLPE